MLLEANPAQPRALDHASFSAPGTRPRQRRSAPGPDPLPGATPITLSWPGLLASSLTENTLPRIRAPAPRSVPHRDERCLRVVVAAGGKAPAPPAAQSGFGPRAPVSDRDHQRLPTTRARRATQPAMSHPSARWAADNRARPAARRRPAPAPHCPAPRPAPLARCPASQAPSSFRRTAGGSPGLGVT